LEIESRVDKLAHEHRTSLQVMMKFEDQLALILTKLDDQSKVVTGTNRCLLDVHESVVELTAEKANFECWRPKVDEQVADLSDSVNTLHQQLHAPKSTSSTALPHPVEPGSESLKVSRSAHLDLSI
jgi:hypothetical protein